MSNLVVYQPQGLLEKAAYTLGKAVAAYDAPLLQKLQVDGIGRALPVQYTGNAAAQWLSSEGSALTRAGYTNHGTAYSIVSSILGLASGLPWGVYRLEKDKPVKLDKHPLYDLLYRPNTRQTWPELKTAVEGGLLLSGNAYLFGVRPEFGSSRGKVNELWAPDPARVEVVGGGFMQDVVKYVYTDDQGRKTEYPPENVLHLKYWNPDDSKYGLSPIAAGIDSVTASKAGLESRVKQYQNQGPAGILSDESDGAEAFDETQARGIQRYFASFRAGQRNAGNLPVLAGVKLKYTQLGMSAVDLDVLAAIPHDKDAVADLYHYPGQLLNGSKGTTFANMGEAGKAAYNRCVIPLETMVRDGVNRWLGKDYNDAVYIDFDTSRVPELQEDLGKLVTTLAAAWWIPTQRKQELCGVEANKDLPEYLFPSTLVTLEDLQAPPVAPDVAPLPSDLAN